MLANVHLVHYGYDLELRGLYLDSLDKMDLSENKKFEFLPGHRYIIVYNDSAKNDDEQPYKIIQNKYGIHYGPRNENHFDYTKAPFLTTMDGIYFKFIYKRYERTITWLDEAQYEGMSQHLEAIKTKLRNAELESGVSKRTGNRWYRLVFEKLKEVGTDVRDFCERPDIAANAPEIKYTKKIRSCEDIKSSMEYFINKPVETVYGCDFETSNGFPMDDPGFQIVGLGIACCDADATAAYYDIQWMQRHGRDGEYELLKEYLNKFFDKFENSVAYNHNYEQRVFYLMLGRLLLLEEGATANKVDGRVYKRFTLKYTAQVCLHVKSWDDEFDILTGHLLPELFGWDEETESYKWKLTADGENEIDSGNVDAITGSPIMVKVPNDYKHNPVWKTICDRYPDQVTEFINLIEYPGAYGEPFACIPSDIQTYYCCRDSFYTGHLKIYSLSKYTELCYYTYCNNLRLESILHLTGFFCNEDLRLKMELQCLWLVVYGKLNTVKFALSEKMKWFKDLTIPDIPEITALLRRGYDPCSSKSIIMNHLSETSESGLDEEALLPMLGQEVLDIYKHYIYEYCFRIDESFSRSRKVFNELDAELKERYNPDYGKDDSEYCKYTVNGVEYKIDLSWDILLDYYSTKENLIQVENFCRQLDFREIEKLVLPHLGGAKLPTVLYGYKNIPIQHNLGVGSWGYVITKDIPNYDIDGNYEPYSLDEVMDWCDEAYNYNSPKLSPLFKFMAFQKYKGVLYHAFTTDYETLPWGSFPKVTDEMVEKCREKEFTIEWIESTAYKLINEDLDRLKTTNAWKYYELNHDVISLLYQGIMEETVYNEETKQSESLFCLTDTGDKDDNGKPIMGWSPEMDEWYDILKQELGGWFDFLPRYIGVWELDEESGDKQKFFDSVQELDVTEETIQSMAKLNFCFTASKKYYKVLGTYIRGVHFSTYNYDVDYFNEDGITPNRYDEKGVHKCYMPFFANAKKSKRWSSGYHTIPSKSEMKRLITTPPGYLMSYFDISGINRAT